MVPGAGHNHQSKWLVAKALRLAASRLYLNSTRICPPELFTESLDHNRIWNVNEIGFDWPDQSLCLTNKFEPIKGVPRVGNPPLTENMQHKS